MGQLAVADPGTLADRDAARGVAGRRRLRRGSPPPHRARRGAGRAERLLPGPAVPALPTIEVRVADVCLDAGTAVLLAGLTRALVATALAEARRGTPAAARRPGRSPRRWPPRRATGSPGQESTRSPGRPSMRRPPVPPPRSCLSRAQGPRRHRDDHQAAAPARPAGDRSRPPASPVHQRRIHARVHHRTRPRDAVRLRARAAGPARCPGPGSATWTRPPIPS